MKYVLLRPLFDGDNFLGFRDVGPVASVEDAKRRYSPVQYGYAVVLRRA